MSVRQVKPATKDGRSWVFSTRYIDLNGKERQHTSGKYKSRKLAEEAEKLFLLKLTDKVNNDDIKFVDLYNSYIDKQKNIVKTTTMRNYVKRWEHLSELGNIKVSDFKYSHYELWRKKMCQKKMSDEYRNDIQKFLKALLNFGSKWYNLDFREVYNKIQPFADPNAPVKEEMKFFTYEEFQQFISAEDKLVYRCAFKLLYYCGLRRGELLGLRWINVSFFDKNIKIKDNAVRNFETGEYMITSPKTKSSVRTIPLTDELISDLKQLKEQCKKIYGFKENWFVLGYEKPMAFSALRDRKNLICDRAEVKQIRLHDFRHSCASLLISKGANITLVAKYLGHAKIDETLNTYSHFFKSDLDNIVNTLNHLF